MSAKEEAENVIRRYNQLIDFGAQELDVELLKEAVKLGIEFNIDVNKIAEKLNELTNESVVHLKN